MIASMTFAWFLVCFSPDNALVSIEHFEGCNLFQVDESRHLTKRSKIFLNKFDHGSLKRVDIDAHGKIVATFNNGYCKGLIVLGCWDGSTWSKFELNISRAGKILSCKKILREDPLILNKYFEIKYNFSSFFSAPDREPSDHTSPNNEGIPRLNIRAAFTEQHNPNDLEGMESVSINFDPIKLMGVISFQMKKGFSEGWIKVHCNDSGHLFVITFLIVNGVIVDSEVSEGTK